jgi:23S rRNA (pseudouridine1915-N3)-methyltransferase
MRRGHSSPRRCLPEYFQERAAMKIRLIAITKRKGPRKQNCVDELSAEYVKRAARYCTVEAGECAGEEALLKSLKQTGRTAPVLVALDSRGKQMSSEELAEFVRQHLERGTQELIFAIGPADGWTAAATAQAQQTLSLGKITLPHELARVVLAEQIYRAFTILHNHPYHGGH